MRHRIKKLIAVFVLICVLLTQSCMAYAQAKSKTTSKQTKKTQQTSGKTATKSKGNSNKKSANGKKSSKSKKSTKSGKKSKKGKRHRRGRAVHVSSHETAAQKKLIAAETARLEAEPDYSGDIPELAEESLVWPVQYGYISRGVRCGHRGVDMMARAGDPVYAVADGVVTFISIGQRAYSGYGKMAIIHHREKNLWSLYSHCSAIYLHEGQEVKRGQKIAAVGRTGRTTSNHLHFELRGEGNKILNPLKYLPEEGKLGHKYVPH